MSLHTHHMTHVLHMAVHSRDPVKQHAKADAALLSFGSNSLIANSDASRPGIPISFRPAFRIDAGHHSEVKPAA
jgi:hypothetical protein